MHGEKKNIEILQGQFKIRLFTLCMLSPVLVLENGSVRGLEMNSCVMN